MAVRSILRLQLNALDAELLPALSLEVMLYVLPRHLLLAAARREQRFIGHGSVVEIFQTIRTERMAA